MQRVVRGAGRERLERIVVDYNQRRKRGTRWLQRLKDRHGFCAACDAGDFGEADDVSQNASAPTRVDTDKWQVIETAGKFKNEPIVTVFAANAEELATFHLEIKREAGGYSESIITYLLECFEFENTFRNLGDGVVDGGASAQTQKAL